jgi:hypothetical protein
VVCGEARRECWSLTVIRCGGDRDRNGNVVRNGWGSRGTQAKGGEINVYSLIVEYVC